MNMINKRWGAALMLAVVATSVHSATAKPSDKPTSKVEAMAQLDFRAVVRGAKAKVFPAVVYIKCIRQSHEQGRKISSEVWGSGVLISPDGELLTNWHVVDKATEVRCLLLDGTAYHADVLGSDKDVDLALLKLRLDGDAPDLPHAALGTSDALTEGDFVMAMGAPFGLARSVSIGIISCTRRYLPDNSQYSLWLQTDAAISPGNSGGPLVDTDGKLVGINTRGVMTGGDMGFAIPVDTIKVLLDPLREHGQVNWSWTGIQLQPIKDFNRNIYFEGTEGVVVAGTDPGSPARRAGLLPQDRIMAINDQPITALTEEDLPDARRSLGLLPKGETASFTIERDGDRLTLEITPREKGEVEGEELDLPRWDMTVKAINQFDNPDLHFHREEGVFVFGVRYPGNAADAGLQEQDIILKVNAEQVVTPSDLNRIYESAMDNLDDRHRVVLTILRNGLMRQLVLDFSRDYEKR